MHNTKQIAEIIEFSIDNRHFEDAIRLLSKPYRIAAQHAISRARNDEYYFAEELTDIRSDSILYTAFIMLFGLLMYLIMM